MIHAFPAGDWPDVPAHRVAGLALERKCLELERQFFDHRHFGEGPPCAVVVDPWLDLTTEENFNVND